MRKKIFLIRTVLFLIPISLIFLSGLFLPPTPRTTTSLLFANIQKDSLLQHVDEPRIIFVGGSNLSFGLNSYKIRDSLGLYPINTGVNAGIGLKYMLENTLKFIKEGDNIILSLEYELFYEPYETASDVLLRTIFDVFPEKSDMLSFKQKLDLVPYIPRYSLTKLKPSEYFAYTENHTYGGNSFNKFGDAYSHWELKGQKYMPVTIGGDFHENVIIKLKEFENAVTEKGGEVYVTFPGIDEVSYQKSEEAILRIEKKLLNNGFTLLGTAKRYIIPAEMVFDTHYHFIKVGVDLRTERFIQDYQRVVMD